MAHQELARLSASGKTFFFNKRTARNDNDYLEINAIWGKGNMERMVLFQPHLIEFRKQLTKAVEKLTGLKFDEPQPEPQEVVECPKFCPSCNFDLLAYYEETSK